MVTKLPEARIVPGQDTDALVNWRRIYNDGPRPDPVSSGVIVAILGSRIVFQNAHLFKHPSRWLIQPWLRYRGKKWAACSGYKQVPRIRQADINVAEIKQMLAEGPIPIIFEGIAADSQAVQQWSAAYFKEHYGDYQVCVDTPEKPGAMASIAEIVDEIHSGSEKTRYIHNVADIFNDHPELEEQLPLQLFEERLETVGKLAGIQMFFGGSGTYTPYHCAGGTNLFFNIAGEKEWFFVHPRCSPWMYGEIHYTGIYALSPVEHRKAPNEQLETYPLYSQVPVYKAHLRPGDVLLNPPWWWHAVNNLTPETIGCATRWVGIPNLRATNPIYTTIASLSPHNPLRKRMKDFLSGKAKRLVTDKLYRNTYNQNQGSAWQTQSKKNFD